MPRKVKTMATLTLTPSTVLHGDTYVVRGELFAPGPRLIQVHMLTPNILWAANVFADATGAFQFEVDSGYFDVEPGAPVIHNAYQQKTDTYGSGYVFMASAILSIT